MFYAPNFVPDSPCSLKSGAVSVKAGLDSVKDVLECVKYASISMKHATNYSVEFAHDYK